MKKKYHRNILYWQFLLAVFVTTLYIPSCTTDNKVKLSNQLEKNFNNSIASAKLEPKKVYLEDALNFNNFDMVCILLPYSSETVIRQDLGFPFQPSIAADDKYWGLLLIKEGIVVAEIEIDRLLVDYPLKPILQKCMNKDSSFILEKNDNSKYSIKFNHTGG